MITTRQIIQGAPDVTDAIGTVEKWLLDLGTNVPYDVFAAWFVVKGAAQQRKGTA